MCEITSEWQCVVRNLNNFLHRATTQDAHIFRIILYKGADQTARMHGLSLSLYLYLHWQTVWTHIGPEYNTANANDNTYHGSLSKATVTGLMDLFQDV